TTDTLNILDALSLDHYQFYCQVRENTATCYTASNAVRLQVARTIWDGTAWSPTAPNINTIAYISGDYTTSSDGSFSACQLFINTGHTLTITDNTFVEVENNTIVNGHLVVENHGAFAQNTDVVNGFTLNPGATAVVNKTTTPLNNWFDYTYWSSP